MHKRWLRFVLREQANGDGGSAGGGDPTPASATPAANADPAPVSTPTGSDPAPAPTPAPTPTPAGNSEPSKSTWPDDWQSRLAKGDSKLAARFQRYASPEAMAEALIAAQNRISSGELKSALPKDPKPEELAAWRKENGIPETPDKYDLKFDDGLVIGDDDKPIIEGFLKAAHERNMTPEQAKGAIGWYYEEQKRLSDERSSRDEQQRQTALDALNAEWGGNFRRNINMVDGLLTRFPEDVRDLFKGGRLADGTAILNHPQVVRALASIALEVNPAGTLVPNGTSDPMKSVEGRIGEIEAQMRKDRVAYNKDEKLQAEYRELLGAREKLKERTAA